MPARYMPSCSRSRILHPPLRCSSSTRALTVTTHLADGWTYLLPPLSQSSAQNESMTLCRPGLGHRRSRSHSPLPETPVQHTKYSFSNSMRLATPGDGWFSGCAIHYTRRKMSLRRRAVIVLLGNSRKHRRRPTPLLVTVFDARGALGQPHGHPIGVFCLILTAVCHLTFHLVELRSLANNCT